MVKSSDWRKSDMYIQQEEEVDDAIAQRRPLDEIMKLSYANRDIYEVTSTTRRMRALQEAKGEPPVIFKETMFHAFSNAMRCNKAIAEASMNVIYKKEIDSMQITLNIGDDHARKYIAVEDIPFEDWEAMVSLGSIVMDELIHLINIQVALDRREI